MKINQIPGAAKYVIRNEYKRAGFLGVLKRIIFYPLKKYDLYIGRERLGKNKKFVECIKNKKVLILGSGPSIKDLKKIPKDVVILTCNSGPKILTNKKIDREIDVYYLPREAYWDYIGRGMDLKDLLKGHKIKHFISDFNIDEGHYILKDNTLNNYYLKKLISPMKLSNMLKRLNLPGGYSSGIRLLQYALYFGAKEVYLIGMDGGFGHHFWAKDKGGYKFPHAKSDQEVIKILSKKYKNIFSASKNSPATNFVKYKKLR